MGRLERSASFSLLRFLTLSILPDMAIVAIMSFSPRQGFLTPVASIRNSKRGQRPRGPCFLMKLGTPASRRSYFTRFATSSSVAKSPTLRVNLISSPEILPV